MSHAKDDAKTMHACVAVMSPALELRMGALLAQCAESKIYACDFYGTPAVCKHRFHKEYRHPLLDRKLREQRTAREARALLRCRRVGVRVPTVYAVDRARSSIIMEYIDAPTVKRVLDEADTQLRQTRAAATTMTAAAATTTTSGDAAPSALVTRLLTGIGEVVGLLHSHDIIHGDLTTSNFLYTGASSSSSSSVSDTDNNSNRHHDSNNKDAATTTTMGTCARDGLVVIDFGLVSDKASAEDRAVDLYVLERAIVATHPFVQGYAADLILDGYRRSMHDAKKATVTLARLLAVRARGRKRSMIG